MNLRATFSSAAALMTVLAAVPLPAQDWPSKNNRSTGVVTIGDASRLKIIHGGRITIQPGNSSTLSYKLSGPTAESVSVATKVTGSWCMLYTGGEDSTLAELTVTVPPDLKQYYFEAHMGRLVVNGINGLVDAVTGAGNIEMDRMGGNVIARSGGGELRFGRVTGSLRCLSGGGLIRAEHVGGEVNLESAGGEIFLGKAGGPIRASTAGNIHISDAGSTVTVHTTGGLIEVERANGVVSAESAGGSIVVGSAPGIRAESAGGTIKLKSISGAVKASTAAGSLFVGFSSKAALQNSFLATMRGDITVFLPSNLAVTVKALNEAGMWRGRIASDYSEIRTHQPSGGNGPLVAEGQLNGGGPLLMLSVSAGSIFVKRQ